MPCCGCIPGCRINPLLFISGVSFCCLLFGLCIAIYDINNYGSGLYLALVSIVTVVVALAFCLVGTDEQTEPTVAKKVWSTTRQTIRKFKKEPTRVNACEIRIVNIDLEAEAGRPSTSSENAVSLQRTDSRALDVAQYKCAQRGCHAWAARTGGFRPYWGLRATCRGLFILTVPAMHTGCLLLCILSAVNACLPGPFGFGMAPGYGAGLYGGVPAFGGMYPGRMGPFRSEGHRQGVSQQAAPQPVQFQAQMDDVQSAASLNCPNFNEVHQCKWGNTNDEELDWVSVSKSPEADRWFGALGTPTYPDETAGALISTQRQGWEGGRLVSDFLQCIGQGLRLTATVWKTRDGSPMEQPKLQVCTRNHGEEKLPLVNCNDLEIRNGVPITAEIPAAGDPFTPAQVVINGYNFMAPAGGALFIQDIVVEGNNGCTLGNSNNPVLIADSRPPPSRGTPSDLAVDGLSGLEAIDAAPQTAQLEDNSVLEQSLPDTISRNNAPRTSNSIGVSPTLFETCLALSCNPSDLNCKFWRSAGNNRWEIGAANRFSNPLTGIHLPPGTSQKFLVAPFLDSHINSYTLVSESITILPLQEIYFCFYEYYATHGLSLVVCTDKMECFYQKNALAIGQSAEENKRWNIRCPKLPVGTYELRVIAENNGDNKGEVGFLPIRIARDPQGLDFIC